MIVLLAYYYGPPWPAVYITFEQITDQIQVSTEPLCRAQVFLCAAEQRAGYQISWVNLQREAKLSVNP